MLDTSAPGQFGTRTLRHLRETFRHPDNSALVFFSLILRTKLVYSSCSSIVKLIIFGSIVYNMKQARPWMRANLKIIWQFHAHPVHQKVLRFFGPRYIGDDFFLGPNLVSFNRSVVPDEISKANFLAFSFKISRSTLKLYQIKEQKTIFQTR
jgi:hypothetical protein